MGVPVVFQYFPSPITPRTCGASARVACQSDEEHHPATHTLRKFPHPVGQRQRCNGEPPARRLHAPQVQPHLAPVRAPEQGPACPPQPTTRTNRRRHHPPPPPRPTH